MRHVLFVAHVAFSLFITGSSKAHAESPIPDEIAKEAENILWTAETAIWCEVFLKTNSSGLSDSLYRYEYLFKSQYGVDYEEALKKQKNIYTYDDWETYKKSVAMMGRSYLYDDRKPGSPYATVSDKTIRKCQRIGKEIGFDFLKEGIFEDFDKDSTYSKVALNIPVREAVFVLCKPDLSEEEKRSHLAEKTHIEKTLISKFGKSSFEYLTHDGSDTKLYEKLSERGKKIYYSSITNLESNEERHSWCKTNISSLTLD